MSPIMKQYCVIVYKYSVTNSMQLFKQPTLYTIQNNCAVNACTCNTICKYIIVNIVFIIMWLLKDKISYKIEFLSLNAVNSNSVKTKSKLIDIDGKYYSKNGNCIHINVHSCMQYYAQFCYPLSTYFWIHSEYKRDTITIH